MGNPVVGRRLAAYRRDRGLTRFELAAAMELDTPFALDRIEDGTAMPSARQLLGAVSALRVTVENLTDPFQLEPGEARWTWRTGTGEPNLSIGTPRCLPLRMRRRLGAGFAATEDRTLAREKRMISHRKV